MSTHEPPELYDCPFCDAPAVLHVVVHGFADYFNIGCKTRQCWCYVHRHAAMTPMANLGETAKLWNDRSTAKRESTP